MPDPRPRHHPRWAEERDGTPSAVSATHAKDDAGILRIDFPDYTGEGALEAITWDEWFDTFDDRDLVFLFQEETAEGELSNFNKLITADTAAGAEDEAEWR
ncbi:MAG: hypothetical protein KC645_12645 [Gemmatimonadetes bacterium]|nr:hypothetical protein [Gemmatimonadota bacterium]